MEARKYIKVCNAEEKLYFHESDLSKVDIMCFLNAGYKVETYIGHVKRKTYLNSIERLKEFKLEVKENEKI
jgi:hypothetical protein